VTAGNQRYAAVPTTNRDVEMPELTEMETSRSPNMPAISPMAKNGSGAVQSVPPPVAFHELNLQRHHSQHAMAYPHPVFAPHSVPPPEANRGRASSTQIASRRHSNQIGRAVHPHRASESYAINRNYGDHGNHRNLRDLRDHRNHRNLGNHGTHRQVVAHDDIHDTIGHQVRFKENGPMPHRSDAKPLEAMTEIHTEVNTVLSDVTSSSSGESTDHADDDQFDSVSTRMRSERKFGRRKHKKHCKKERKEKRLNSLQRVQEEVEEEELNALKQSDVSAGFQPSRKHTEFTDERYVD